MPMSMPLATRQFTNVAEASARLAVQNAFGAKIERQSQLTIPWCTYCDPEIAHIGMQMREARRQHIPVKCFMVMMQDVDRAITDGQDDGFVKLYVKEGTDKILGATIVATRASELLHTYPTHSDAIRLAAMAYVNNQPVSPC